MLEVQKLLSRNIKWKQLPVWLNYRKSFIPFQLLFTVVHKVFHCVKLLKIQTLADNIHMLLNSDQDCASFVWDCSWKMVQFGNFVIEHLIFKENTSYPLPDKCANWWISVCVICNRHSKYRKSFYIQDEALKMVAKQWANTAKWNRLKLR